MDIKLNVGNLSRLLSIGLVKQDEYLVQHGALELEIWADSSEVRAGAS